MNVNLTPQLEQYVQQKVASGQYNNASEVLREALREKIAREAEYEREQEAKLAWLRQAIQEGLYSPVEPMEDLDTLIRLARENKPASQSTRTRR
jgi:antitoxin ParD1/3/4